MSNTLLDLPWPKVTRGKKLLAELLEQSNFIGTNAITILADTCLPDDKQLPDRCRSKN